MSIQLDWENLDPSLSSKLIDILNKQLSTTQRPSFIGPIQVLSLELGSNPPEVELVDLRDIYRDFLEDDEDSVSGPVKVTQGAADEDDFEWVSRKVGRGEEGIGYTRVPTHLRYSPGRGGPAMDMFSSLPALPPHADIWNPGLPGLHDFRPGYTSWPGSPVYRSPTPAAPATAPLNHGFDHDALDYGPPIESADANPVKGSPQEGPVPPVNNYPNLQLHLHINWQSNLRLTLTTSLLINYPSPMFMSLPIKLAVTGLIFTGEVAVAYEGERKRVHLCILDELDPYGPAAERPKRDSGGGSPPELDEDLIPSRPPKPSPIGQRLLPSISIESEIGQTDKHVLKNVTRVERFIQDVIRKTLEEELVFPNFHTLLMGDATT